MRAIAPPTARIFKAEQTAYVLGGKEVASRTSASGVEANMRIIACKGGYKVLILPGRGDQTLPYYLER